MRIRAAAAMATVLVCAASSGFAKDQPPGQFHLYGSGGVSCGEWVAERNELTTHMSQFNWVLGWVSAADNYNVQGDLRHTDPDAIAAWVDKYCREHPQDHVYDAAARLVDQLSKTK